MKKIVAFGGSTSSKSINRQLAKWAADQIQDSEVNLLDLNDYEMPLYSMDREEEAGIPEGAFQFKDTFRECDGIIISLAEHNGSYSAAFKNIMDWTSRIKEKLWLDKPIFLLATSPGQRGGTGVFSAALAQFPFLGGSIAGSFSLPSFNNNFDAQKGITDAELKGSFDQQRAGFELAI